MTFSHLGVVVALFATAFLSTARGGSYAVALVEDIVPFPSGFPFTVELNGNGDLAGIYVPNPLAPGDVNSYRYVGGIFEDLRTSSPVGLGVVSSINDNGDVAARTGSPGGRVVLRYTFDGIIEVSDVIGDDGDVYSINNLGQIVGESDSGAFVWTPGGIIEILPGLGGARSSRAWDINNLGWIVGEGDASLNEGNNAPILWIPGESPLQIGGDGFFGRATDVNDVGGIIGESGGEVFFWQGGSLIDGFGHLFQDFNDMTFDITERVLSGGINDFNQVVGTSRGNLILGGQFTDGWLWTEGGGTVFLDSLIDPGLGLNIFGALDINNAGQILVSTNQGFALLTPIPEPSISLLTAFAVIVFLVRRRR